MILEKEAHLDFHMYLEYLDGRHLPVISQLYYYLVVLLPNIKCHAILPICALLESSTPSCHEQLVPTQTHNSHKIRLVPRDTLPACSARIQEKSFSQIYYGLLALRPTARRI